MTPKQWISIVQSTTIYIFTEVSVAKRALNIKARSCKPNFNHKKWVGPKSCLGRPLLSTGRWPCVGCALAVVSQDMLGPGCLARLASLAQTSMDEENVNVFVSSSSFLFLKGLELIERMSFFGIVSNLITVLHQDLKTAAKNVNYWGGVTKMLPLIGGFLADAYLGRYSTVLFLPSSMLW